MADKNAKTTVPVNFENILFFMRQFHPDWSEASLRYTADIVLKDMRASGATMDDYRKQPWVIEEGAEQQYGDFNAELDRQTKAVQQSSQYGSAYSYVTGLSDMEVASRLLNPTGDAATDREMLMAQLAPYYRANPSYNPDSAYAETAATDPTWEQQTTWQAQQDEIQRQFQAAQSAQQLEWQRQQADAAAAQSAQQLAWQQQQAAAEAEQWRQANTWTKYVDESGTWQRNQLGQVQYLGEVPAGEVQNIPSTWAGWGQEWGQNKVYNPATQRMDVRYQAKPLGWQDALAQSQWANQPGNWIDVALMNRTLPQDQQKYNTYVGDTVGRMVESRPGYASNYDLQSGQAATGITPAGWYDTSRDSNAWQQGYGAQYGGTGTGEGGGYLTRTPSWQDYMGWNQSAKDQMSGWLNSGMSDWTQEQDYWDKANRMRAPGRYTGVSWK